MNTDFYQTYFAIEKKHWLMRVRRKIMHDQMERHLFPFNSSTKILDVGSGSGVLVGEFQARGMDAYGVDSASEAIEYGTKEGVRNLALMPTTNKLPFPDNHFDGVLAMDVLEHLPSEADVLSEIKRVLKKDGVLFITVPAYMFLWGRQDEVSQHFRRYTMGRLIEALRQSGGFTILKRSYFNTFLFPLVALVRMGSWMLNRRGQGSDFELNNPILNTLFFAVFDFERRILRYFNYPFGVSILMIVRKDK